MRKDKCSKSTNSARIVLHAARTQEELSHLFRREEKSFGDRELSQ